METGLIGKTFNRWVVILRGKDYVYPKSGKNAIRYECKCACGVIKLVHKSHLLNGNSQSCGCLNREISTTHGLSYSRAYKAWSHMLRRCSGVSVKDNPHYLDKGITVCERWKHSAEDFLEDMGECPDGYELDRIDYNGNYEPSNCRWVNEQTQAENRGKFKNNTSGTTGVGLVKNYLKSGKENFYWRAYRDTGGTRQTKNFSVNKLGYETAKNMAVEFRNEVI
jgi:hypothetical protein